MAAISRFLQLPGEIRNSVYEYVLDGITTLRINKNGFLVPPPIATICRQIHEEVQASGFLGYSLATRPSIQRLEAHVVDWDFRHIVKFLKNAAEHGIAAVKEIRIKWQLTTAEVDEDAAYEWFDQITEEQSNSRVDQTTIDVGNRIRKPVSISYDVHFRNVLGDRCACLRVIEAFYRHSAPRKVSRARYQTIFTKLLLAIHDSYANLKRQRSLGEAQRTTRRYIRRAERGRAEDMAFWLQRIKTAILNGQDTSMLYKMFSWPKKGREIVHDPNRVYIRQSQKPLELLIRYHVSLKARGGRPVGGRKTSTRLADRCQALRRSKGLLGVRTQRRLF